MKYKEVMQNPNITWISNDAISKRINAEFYDVEIGNVVNKMKQVFGDNIKNLTEFIILKDTGRNYLDTNQSNSYKYLKVNNLKEVLPDYSSLSYINKEDINTKDKLLELGDILFVRVGVTSGVSSIIASKDVRGCFSDNIIRIRLNQDILNPFYCSVFLSSKYGKTLINRHLKGTARPLISYELFEDVLIPIPSPEIQKYIGDKVRRAEELREESKLLREEAEEYINKKLGFLNLDEDKQYSSAFIPSNKIIDRIDSEYYNIRYLNIEEEFEKRGYKIKTLDELCTRIYNGKTYSTSIKESKYINIGVGELGDWFINKNSEKFINDIINKKYCLKKNSIIWGNAAHLAKYIGEKVNMIFEDDVIIPTTEVTAIEPNEEVIDPYYLFLFMRSQWGYYQIQRTVKGMTAHSYPQDIERILVPIIELTTEEKEKLKSYVVKSFTNEVLAKQLIQEAKQDVEDLIEGNFDMSKLNETTTESR